MRITLVPSRRVLETSHGETVLETCRRLGEPISYSCIDGRCGLCRCFVSVVGEQPRSDTPAVVLPEFEERLACQTTPLADCLVEIPDPHETVVLPARGEKGTVVSVERQAASIIRLTLELKRPIRRRGGQQFELGFGGDLKRLYSASNPSDEQHLVFDIQTHPYGSVSNHVGTALRVGDPVRIRGPLGRAYLRKADTSNLLLMSSGTGLGPMLSLMSDIAAAQMPNAIYIYSGHAFSEQVYGRAELIRAADALANVRKCEFVVASGPLQRGDRRGLLTSVISKDFDSLRGWSAYLFGSPNAIDASARMLLAKDANPRRLYTVPFQFAAHP